MSDTQSDKNRMDDAEVREFLRDNEYPEHVVQEGRPGLIRSWREFVERVERGYRFGLEDYRNDLDVRGILELIGGEDRELQALDARLKLKLTNTDVRVWESGPGDPFWDFGYPQNAGSELKTDLTREGLIES